MINTAIVQEKRDEMLALRSEVEGLHSSYREQAHRRIALQQKVASVLQCLQEASQNKDVALVEDTIVVGLQTETKVKRSRRDIPPKPFIPDAADQPQGRTSSAEEAYAVYTSQVETLTQDRAYRNGMMESEATMAILYQEGLDRILEVVNEYCTNPNLQERVQSLAA